MTKRGSRLYSLSKEIFSTTNCMPLVIKETYSQLLEIILCSLKSVKWLPDVQNDSPVMNSLGSLDSHRVNTLGGLHSPVVNTLGSLNSFVINTLGSWLLGVFGTSIRTGLRKTFSWQIYLGVKTPQCINLRGTLTFWCVLHQQVFL
jgi:hypothetical protein